MAVCSVEKTKDYAALSNYHLYDERLTGKAKGLLSRMLSPPGEWDYTIAGLAALCKEGKDAIRAAVEELETVGYIQRHQLHAEDGSFTGNEYIIYETPQAPLSEKPTTVEDVNAPLSGFPLTRNPLTGNPTQSSKDISSIDIITPSSKSETEEQSRPPFLTELEAGPFRSILDRIQMGCEAGCYSGMGQA